MTRRAAITLVGDSIENLWNARTMIDAAAMFGGGCRFRDHGRLATAWQETIGGAAGFTPGEWSPFERMTAGEGRHTLFLSHTPTREEGTVLTATRL